MKQENKKKLLTIKKKVLTNMWQTMAAGFKEDEDYKSALKLLGDAMMEIERTYGDLD